MAKEIAKKAPNSTPYAANKAIAIDTKLAMTASRLSVPGFPRVPAGPDIPGSSVV
jgi:hypothetical protein